MRSGASAASRTARAPSRAATGHGPQWNLTRRIDGQTVNVHLKPGPELDKAGAGALTDLRMYRRIRRVPIRWSAGKRHGHSQTTC